jgi:hypothetical protein
MNGTPFYFNTGMLGPEFPECNGEVNGTVLSLFFFSVVGGGVVGGGAGVDGVLGVEGTGVLGITTGG